MKLLQKIPLQSSLLAARDIKCLARFSRAHQKVVFIKKPHVYKTPESSAYKIKKIMPKMERKARTSNI
jgi:hypothetical protein